MFLPLRRPAPPADVLPLFSPEAVGRLERFVPPFAFTSFFSPEDTLLCVIAAEAALARATPVGALAAADAGRGAPPEPQRRAGTPGTQDQTAAAWTVAPPALRIVELTAGSGLVGFRLLDLAPSATLLGVDVDAGAPPVARANAAALGVADRTEFAQMSVWDDECEARLAEQRVDVLICNPPYIPEPPDARLAVEAGSGADGAAHLRRVAELAGRVRPRTVALSWCSLGDPAGVAAAMEQAGYRLDALHAVAIADGEYSGLVQSYLETLPTAFLNRAAEARRAMAGDGAARFAYVLLAGVWVEARRGSPAAAPGSVGAIEALMRDFARRGLSALAAPDVPFAYPFAYRAWLLDRWDEIALRAALHGPTDDASGAPGASAPVRRA